MQNAECRLRSGRFAARIQVLPSKGTLLWVSLWTDRALEIGHTLLGDAHDHSFQLLKRYFTIELTVKHQYGALSDQP